MKHLLLSSVFIIILIINSCAAYLIHNSGFFDVSKKSKNYNKSKKKIKVFI